MNKTLLGVVAAGAAVYGAWHWHRSGSSAAQHDDDTEAAGPKLAFDRIWIDHLPTSERDTINIYFALHEEALGVFQKTSAWRGAYEGFRFEADKGEMRVVFPQTGERETIALKASKCHDVEGMDYCLDIKGASRGVAHYYSAEGWEIGGGVTAGLELADKIVHSSVSSVTQP